MLVSTIVSNIKTFLHTVWIFLDSVFVGTFLELHDDTRVVIAGTNLKFQEHVLGKPKFKFSDMTNHIYISLCTLFILGILIGLVISNNINYVSNAFYLLILTHVLAAAADSIAKFIHNNPKGASFWLTFFKGTDYFIMVTEITILVLWLPRLVAELVKFITGFA